jgi:hypothetical protein
MKKKNIKYCKNCVYYDTFFKGCGYEFGYDKVMDRVTGIYEKFSIKPKIFSIYKDVLCYDLNKDNNCKYYQKCNILMFYYLFKNWLRKI